MRGLWRSTRPPFHQHNSEGCKERQEQHQLVGHDEAPPRRAGLPAGRVFTELRCQLREDDQQARCINRAAGSWFLCRTSDVHGNVPIPWG